MNENSILPSWSGNPERRFTVFSSENKFLFSESYGTFDTGLQLNLPANHRGLIMDYDRLNMWSLRVTVQNRDFPEKDKNLIVKSQK